MDDSLNSAVDACAVLNAQPGRSSPNRSAPVHAGEFELKAFRKITDEELATFETIDLGNNESSDVENSDAACDSGQPMCRQVQHSDETLPILNVERSRWRIRRHNRAHNRFCEINLRLEKIVYSKGFLPFWVLLLLLPISAGIMGAMYLGDCTFGEQHPYIFITMGITGVIVIICRILLTLHNTTWEERIKRKTLQTILLISLIVTLILHGSEFLPFSTLKKSINPLSKDYCNPSFTRYALWASSITLLIIMPILTFTVVNLLSQCELVKS